MKKNLLFLSLLLISGCEYLSNIQSPISEASNSINAEVEEISGCPVNPGKLSAAEVKTVSLTDQSLTQSGNLRAGQNIGYAFEGKAGQQLRYQTDDDICLWIFNPNNNLLTDTELTQDETYLVQVSIPRGSRSFEIGMSLSSLNAENPDDLEGENNSDDPYSSSVVNHPDFHEEDALKLVTNWYDAKPSIFGPSFDSSLVERYTTGLLYQNTLKTNGSMDWLRKNGCYYAYDFSSIEEVAGFSNAPIRPYLKIKIREKLQLLGSQSAGCGSRPKDYTAYVTYWFEQDNGTWKIHQYSVEN